MSGAERVLTRPTVGAPVPWAFPEPATSILPNGLRLLLVHQPGQHVLSLRMTLPAPVSHEEPGTEGSTLLMVQSLDEGTDRHTADELAELSERHGIALGGGAGERGVHLGVEVTARHLPVALELVGECLTAPTFPGPEVARLARHRMADIAHERADPGSRASAELRGAYFDPRDRPHRPLGGTPESVGSLTPDVLRARHAALGPTGGAVVLAGDLSTVDGPEQLLARTLGAWSAGAPQAPTPPGPARRADDAARLVLVRRPGLAQTELALARPGPDRRTAHGWGTYQALSLLLGGSPHARLDRVLREERGYTYGMRLGFRPRSVGGQCVVGGSVRSDATLPATEQLLSILDVAGAELTTREVREAADFTAMTAPGRYLTADAVADEIVSLVGDGLEPGTVTRTLAQLHDLTRDQAAAAWDEVRRGPGWTVVAVGDPEQIDALADLGLGPVRVVEG
ncbi:MULTISPECIES: M16 family metallopeptidase [unclassified Serinicoccus]|uniref:M16 family metallopeptidase n=1 Tax=unclassified Serinicoccus TaxID=2643101 RepID=UPI003854B2DA